MTEIINVRKLAQDWSEEISHPWLDIEDELLNAAFAGEFADLFARDRRVAIYFLDPETRTGEAYAGPDLARLLTMAASDAELTFYYFARSAKEAELYAIHRDAVLHFAQRRGLAAPSWWKQE